VSAATVIVDLLSQDVIDDRFPHTGAVRAAGRPLRDDPSGV
jgi:hypothetical protein